MRIRISLAGRQHDAADTLPQELALSEGASLDDALAAVQAHDPSARRLPESCLLVVSGRHVGTVGKHPPVALRDGDELLLISPVAGG